MTGQEVVQVLWDKKAKRVAWVRLPTPVLAGLLAALLAGLAYGARAETAPPPLSPVHAPAVARRMPPASWPGYRAVEALATSGRAQEALRQLDLRLVQRPEDARAAYMKGLVLMQLGRGADAERWFKMMQGNFPELAQPYNALAVIYFGRGDLLSAQNVLQAVLAQHPDNRTAQRNLAEIYLRLARESYEKIRKTAPEDARIAAIINALDALNQTSGLP